MLEALAYDKALLMALREATGIPHPIPRGGAVVLDEVGDFQGLHRDSVKSAVTVAVALSEDLPPMGWAPGLVKAVFGSLAWPAQADETPTGPA
ncbi:hypothetical protein ACGFY6_32150 [Streptomyces sp. NPDC048387]|uniref:hypothetical protein n=1 Tax=Streptomyces sp. NPDC048387 TaxID=3365542 RepID=UPI003714A617